MRRVRRIAAGLADALQDVIAEIRNPEPWAAAVIVTGFVVYVAWVLQAVD